MKRFLNCCHPWIGLLRILKVLKKTPLDLQKRFPEYHACPQCVAAYRCGSAFPENGLASRQDFEKMGKTLVDWKHGIVHCVLIPVTSFLTSLFLSFSASLPFSLSALFFFLLLSHPFVVALFVKWIVVAAAHAAAVRHFAEYVQCPDSQRSQCTRPSGSLACCCQPRACRQPCSRTATVKSQCV